VRDRLVPSLLQAEAAHAALLAKCGLLSAAPAERLASQRERVPAIASPPPPPPAAHCSEAAFFCKVLVLPGTRSLPVRAHADVPDEALWVAADRVGRMLRAQSPAVRGRLERASAAIHIVGRRQSVSDLPEYRHLRGKRGEFAAEAQQDPRRVVRFGLWAERSEDGRSFRLPLLSAESLTVDERTRGMGGVQASCGEENLLGLDVDPRYRGRDSATPRLSIQCSLAAHRALLLPPSGRMVAATHHQAWSNSLLAAVLSHEFAHTLMGARPLVASPRTRAWPRRGVRGPCAASQWLDARGDHRLTLRMSGGPLVGLAHVVTAPHVELGRWAAGGARRLWLAASRARGD
jgi:hypothetical protein